MWANALAAIASAGLNLFGQQKANATNRDIANAQMAFQGDMTQQQMDYGREMVGRQEDFQRASIAQQQDYNTASAREAMLYANQMSSSAYQRGMSDMRLAGLNPILAYSQGGATSPAGVTASSGTAPGATASVSAPPGASARMENELSGAVASAAQSARVVTELEQLAANVKRTEADTALLGEQQHQVRQNTALQTAQAITEGVRPELIRAQTRTEGGRPALVGAQAAQAGSSAAQTQQNIDLTSRFGRSGMSPGDLASQGTAIGGRMRTEVESARPAPHTRSEGPSIGERIQNNLREQGGMGQFFLDRLHGLLR